MTIEGGILGPTIEAPADPRTEAMQAIDLILNLLSDEVDHPEVWPLVPALAAENPSFETLLYDRTNETSDPHGKLKLCVLIGLVRSATSSPQLVFDQLRSISIDASHNVQIQGALFYIESLIDPDNEKFNLSERFCLKPFTELNVLEGSTHLCCASWLPQSTGDMTKLSADHIWNGSAAQAIRASIMDGTYRFCNKRTCPAIQQATLPSAKLVAADPKWSKYINSSQSIISEQPEMINLSYDRTCNLSCPSCRTGRYAADEITRQRYDNMQEEKILPMLKYAKSVYITGSGDPFSSKNFRSIITKLSAEKYPNLKFILMTNGMLFTPRQWDAFPSLHNRVDSLHISLDAARGPTHELLRRGAKWSVMEDNLAFAARLYRDGLIDNLCLSFTVQQENYREVGEFVDLAHRIGANRVYFGLVTNWGAFSIDEYRRKAVFDPAHPEHDDFVAHMQDTRLRDAIVAPSNLNDFMMPVAES